MNAFRLGTAAVLAFAATACGEKPAPVKPDTILEASCTAPDGIKYSVSDNRTKSVFTYSAENTKGVGSRIVNVNTTGPDTVVMDNMKAAANNAGDPNACLFHPTAATAKDRKAYDIEMARTKSCKAALAIAQDKAKASAAADAAAQAQYNASPYSAKVKVQMGNFAKVCPGVALVAKPAG